MRVKPRALLLLIPAVLLAGYGIYRKMTWNIAADAEQFAFKTVGGDAGFSLAHTFEHETTNQGVNEDALARYLRARLRGARISSIHTKFVANGGALGDCRFYVRVDDRLLPMANNVYWSPKGPRQTLWHAILVAWRVEAFRNQDHRNLMAIYAEYTRRDQAELQAMGVTRVYWPVTNDPGRDWNEVYANFAQLAEETGRREKYPRGDGT